MIVALTIYGIGLIVLGYLGFLYVRSVPPIERPETATAMVGLTIVWPAIVAIVLAMMLVGASCRRNQR